MCIGANLDRINDFRSLIKSYRSLFYKVKVNYQELTDEEQWEVITKSFEY